MRRSAFLVLALLPGLLRAQGATVTGVVRDSLARAALGGAMVQLVPADSLARFGSTTTADSLGRFTIAGVPDGRYMLGFHHPMLDSLGVEAPLREVHVSGARAVRADLATPSPARLRAAICGAHPLTDSSGVVVGVVRDARDHAPLPGVSVSAEWLELTFTTDGVRRRVPRLVATTGENGWFAICNVPAGGTMQLVASRGVDSTGRIDVVVPAPGFARRELHLGAARTLSLGDSATPMDSVRLPSRRMQVGEGRLSGIVVGAPGGRPLAVAQVGIADGPQTRANERGEWTLVDAPLGTRVLEVRAVGYYPERRPVDVVADAPPVRIALSTFKAVLDTVRITASRMYDRSGFQQRSRGGPGRYFTAQDVAARRPLVTSELFRMMPGMRVETEGMEARVLMRGPFGPCAPSFFVNGLELNGLSAADIDDVVSPREITGMEVYDAATVPPQYQLAMNGCGAVLIWTRSIRPEAKAGSAVQPPS